MSEPEMTLEELLQKSVDLQNQIAEKQNQIEQTKREAAEKEAAEKEAARQEVLRRPFKVTFFKFNNGTLHTGSDYRDDIVSLMRTVPSRQYTGARENLFAAKFVAELVEKLQEKPNVEIEWREGVKEALEEWLNRPDYKISLEKDGKDIRIDLGIDVNSWEISRITGAQWKSPRNSLGFWAVPQTEAWKLAEVVGKLREQKKKVWISMDAENLMMRQIRQRAERDKIAALDDIEYDPGFINGWKLRPFQRVGAAFAETTGGRMLLADQMGLGKTWQAVAYAWKNKLRTVVICPASLKINWMLEIKKLTGQDATVLSGSIPSKHDMLTMLIDKPMFCIINYDIVARKIDTKTVTKDEEGFDHEKYEEDWLWVNLINMAKIELVVFDEAHYIKNISSLRSKACRMITAPHVICMTGTPVMNRPGELWPLLHMLDKQAFPFHDYFVGRYTADGRNARNVDELRALLKPYMIRRLKADVLQELPPVNRIIEHHELSPKAAKLYKKVLDGVYELIAEWNPSLAGDQKKVTNILVQIMRLKQVCSYDKMDSTAELATEIYDSSNHKVIVFSQFVGSVHGIARRLGQEALCITGEQKSDERMRLVQQFQTDESIHFAICSTKAVSEGLTMTAAWSVIFNDQMWTPAAHEQAEGRAYGRLNDAHAIDSYWMVAAGTIEDYIMEVLNNKMAIIDQVIEGVDRDASIAMDIIEKLRGAMGQ